MSAKEQEKRFRSRIKDPKKQWKLSAMDLESYRRWDDYTLAYNRMFEATSTQTCPWYVVDADDKKNRSLKLYFPPSFNR